MYKKYTKRDTCIQIYAKASTNLLSLKDRAAGLKKNCKIHASFPRLSMFHRYACKICRE